MELFLHPWSMIAAGALVSSPIIIHLINRMRFKRIRWAAMEFLLKSQKRNRRRLIIEQMILLLLRILLVLLIGFLVARFIGGALGNTSKGTMHVVVLDDTLSMGDRWGEKGQRHTAFETAKDQIALLAKTAALANSAQHMQIYLLSDLTTPLYDKRLDDRAELEVKTKLEPLKPNALHIEPAAAIEKGRALLNSQPHGQKVLHFVSDFRDSDWGASANLEELTGQIAKLTEAGANLSLLDAAHPFRSETKGVALHHDNLAIVDFRAEARMAAEGVPIELVVTIQNNGTKDVKSFLSIYVDGRKDLAVSQPTDTLPAGQKTEQRFNLLFAKKQPRPEFVHVCAALQEEESGLLADNVRDLIIEVRKKIPTLVIDAAGREGQRPGGDSFHLDVAFAASRSYQAEFKTLDDLETLDLSSYPSIYLLSVQQIKNEAVLNKLADYVKNGGSVAYFLGSANLSTTFYNDVLHKKHNGLFPLMLASRPTDALSPEEREQRKQKDAQPKLLFRDPNHPIVKEGLAPYRSAFRYLMIDRYWPAQPRSQWNPENEKEKVEEVITLPNRRSVDEYKDRARELRVRMLEQVRDLAAADKAFEKYVPVMEKQARNVTLALDTPFLHNLILVLDAQLEDPGDPKNPARPSMKELWAQPSMRALAQQLREFKTTVEFGDPLLVARPYGRGRVIACLTAAGTASGWNEWGGGNPVSWSYQPFIMDLQRYLTSSSDSSRTVSADDAAAIRLEFPADRFQEEVEVRFQPQPDLERKKPDGDLELAEPIKDKRVMVHKDARRIFTYRDVHQPGVYTLEFKSAIEGQPNEVRTYAYNVDALAESDLKRSSREKLEMRGKEQQARKGKIGLISPGEDFSVFKARDPDASESPWLYLAFMIVLVVEQALAVHLSFHLRPGEAAAPPARAPAQPAAA